MKIVTDCSSVRAGEKVLVVTDFETFPEAELIAQAAITRGGNVTVAAMSVRDLDGHEPEDPVAGAMRRADVIFMAVQKSLAHTKAARSALEAGARILSLTSVSMDLLASSAFAADFRRAAPLCEKFGRIFDEASTLSITSKQGTNFTTNLEGRRGNAHKCIVREPGDFSAAPNTEANFSPVENTSEGVIVADASIPYLGIGALTTPVTFHVTNGAVSRVEGGMEARKIERIWREQDDPGVYNIAQVAVGLNPKILEAIGTLGCNYDEGAFGTMHIGIGTSSNLGGKVFAATHFDVVMRHPTLIVDGHELIRDGVILITA